MDRFKVDTMDVISMMYIMINNQYFMDMVWYVYLMVCLSHGMIA